MQNQNEIQRKECTDLVHPVPEICLSPTIRQKTLFTENADEYRENIKKRPGKSFKENVYQIWCKSDEQVPRNRVPKNVIIILIRHCRQSSACFRTFRQISKSHKVQKEWNFGIQFFAACRSVEGQSIAAKIFWKTLTITE